MEMIADLNTKALGSPGNSSLFLTESINNLVSKGICENVGDAIDSFDLICLFFDMDPCSAMIHFHLVIAKTQKQLSVEKICQKLGRS